MTDPEFRFAHGRTRRQNHGAAGNGRGAGGNGTAPAGARRLPRSAPRTTGSSTCGRWPTWTTCASAPRKDLESTRQFAVEKFAQDLIAVKDSLELASPTAEEGEPKSDVASLVEGQNATLAPAGQGLREGADRRGQSGRAAVQSGISRSHDGAAQRCAAEHGAVGRAEGYQLNGRLLRPARVIVSAPKS